MVARSETVGEQQETGRTPKLPKGLILRLMEDRDRVRVGELLSEQPQALRDDYMLSLVAEQWGRIVAVLRGWLGHPHGHIEVFHVDMQVSPKTRIRAGVWLLRAFEGLLESIGADGWTAMTNIVNGPMRRMLMRRGAQVCSGTYYVFVKKWS